MSHEHVNEILKIAKDPSWWEKQKGATRALSGSKSGFASLFIDPELARERRTRSLKGGIKGFGYGASGGALVGLLASLFNKGASKSNAALIGSILGGTSGLTVGNIVGMMGADKDFLKKKGISTSHLGFSSKFSPKAKKKYIDSHR